MGAPSSNHWTTREFPVVTINVIIFCTHIILKTRIKKNKNKNQDQAIYIKFVTRLFALVFSFTINGPKI